MLVHVGKHVYQMPDFIHEFGDYTHHMSMMRTCERTEEGEYIPFTGPSNLAFIRHKCLDVIFYMIRRFLIDYDGAWFHDLIDIPLSFLWGLNCNFPPRDVALHTVWDLRGCKPIRVWDEKENIIYPSTSS